MEFCQVVAEGHPSLCASWVVRPGDRVALAGPSGSGKSLQIDVLAGYANISSGTIAFAPGMQRLAVCRNDLLPRTEASVEQFLLMSIPVLRAHRKGRSAAHVAVVDLVDAPSLQTPHANLLDECAQRFEIADVLKKPVRELSAREAVIVGIARLAMWRPEILLLDDVTDDLPAEACELLEEVLTWQPPVSGLLLRNLN